MKKLCWSAWMLSLIFCSALSAQVAGRWEGTAEIAGRPLLIAFDISSANSGGFSATMDVPAQGAKALPCDEVKVEGDSLYISIKMINGRYAGSLKENVSRVEGSLNQGKMNAALLLKRTGDVRLAVRPQTPKPPFPYKSEDVTYENPNKTVRLSATLTLPSGKGPFPAAILITGSGPQDRDGTIEGHKSFLVIADYLTRRGIAVLRVDDRNAGKSTGPAEGTSADFAQDVTTSLDFLKNRKDIDPKKTGLIGHSEGGMIAPMVATQRPGDVAFVVSLAGPGERILDLMGQQNTAALKSLQVAEPTAESYGTMMRAIMQAAVTTPDSAAFYHRAGQALAAWREKTNPAVVAALTAVTDSASQQRFLYTLDKSLRTPWMQYFLAYDPAENLRKLTCPVLALNGEKDIQVLSKPNLAGWEAAARGKDFTMKEIPGLNHLFQQCQKCTQAEYGELTETFSPEALTSMGDWLVQKLQL